MSWFEYFFSTIIPAIMIICGWIMWKRPPKKINYFIGYRTEMPMKNEKTWAFAHRHCGRTWVLWGVISLVATIAVILFVRVEAGTLMLVLTLAQTLVLIIAIAPTQHALKKNFDENGLPKE